MAFLQVRDWGSEELSILFSIAQLVSSRAGSQSFLPDLAGWCGYLVRPLMTQKVNSRWSRTHKESLGEKTMFSVIFMETIILS